ncbi:hypothetical protein [Streptomyces sp. NPDC087300]|uniref:hypothetical protein n=1 Tax=Streptomyces sp. NPDC087300 TaxID=3365780 RepID=UPI0038165896
MPLPREPDPGECDPPGGYGAEDEVVGVRQTVKEGLAFGAAALGVAIAGAGVLAMGMAAGILIALTGMR